MFMSLCQFRLLLRYWLVGKGCTKEIFWFVGKLFGLNLERAGWWLGYWLVGKGLYKRKLFGFNLERAGWWMGYWLVGREAVTEAEAGHHQCPPSFQCTSASPAASL